MVKAGASTYGCGGMRLKARLKPDLRGVGLLRAGRYRACEGLNTGELRPYAEQPLPAK